MMKLMKHLGLEIPEWRGPVVVERAELVKPDEPLKPDPDALCPAKAESSSHHNGIMEGASGTCPGLGLVPKSHCDSVKQECPSPVAAKRRKAESLLT